MSGLPAAAESPAAPSANILFHIGYHKTASTFLQFRLFDSAAHGFVRLTGGQRPINANLVAVNSFYELPAAIVTQIDSEAAAATAAGRSLVVSHERLSGYPGSGGYDSRLIADRLHRSWPHARVLVVIREQKSFIGSMYSQYVTDGGDQSIRRFLFPPEPHIRRVPGWDFAYPLYDRLIAHYASLFGAGRVLALPFELLVRDSRDFLGRVVRFCGGDLARLPPLDTDVVNVRRPLLMQSATRILNRLLFRSQLNPHGLLPARRGVSPVERLRPVFNRISPAFIERRLEARLKREVTRALAGEVGAAYAASNRRTSGMIGIDLADFGYDCG